MVPGKFLLLFQVFAETGSGGGAKVQRIPTVPVAENLWIPLWYLSKRSGIIMPLLRE
jgi:hypothetical protein